MASYRKSTVNRQQQKYSFVNGNNNDTKYKRSGVVVPNRIFVGGICPTATEDDLHNLFGQYGTVKAIKIVLNPNGSPKGYGFVTFEKAEDLSRLQNDAKNLVINDKRLNIAPAVMKNPPVLGRYSDSFMMPVTPNLYFTNNVQYQYQENSNLYPNATYAPQVTVVPSVPDAAYYPGNYGIPTTPYQGAALYYPMPHNASPIIMGPQPFSSYQAIPSNNSNYVYSSPATLTTTPVKTTKNSTSMTATNTSEIQGSHGTHLIAAVPNVSSLPPPLPYQLPHPSQYYNSSVMPSYSGEVYYNMVHGPCYPMIPMNGQESYIPYYDVSESCSSNNNSIPAEESSLESQHSYQASVIGVPSYASDKSSKESSPSSNNNNNNNHVNNNHNVNNVHNTEAKQITPIIPAPTAEHIQDQVYSADANACNVVVPQTPAPQSQPPSSDFNTSTFVQHRSTASAAIIYPNTPVPQPNIYYSSVYVTEATSSSLAQCPYPKNLSDHYVSDHLPKRDSKYTQKKFNMPQNKEIPPNIPKFPYFMNNNYPGFVNRNVKEKDYKNANNKNGDNKTPPRMPRNNNAGSNQSPKPRVFHNQNQCGPPSRSQRNERNGQMMPPNVQYPRSGVIPQSRQLPFEHPQSSAYEYQNNYQGQASYTKNNNYDNHRKYNQHNSGGFKGKYDKINPSSTAVSYSNKSVAEDRSRKYSPQHEAAVLPINERIQLEQNATVNGNAQQQQVCVEMQNLTL